MSNTKKIAFCGVIAALAVVIMCIGTMLPFMTYVCPVICMAILGFLYKLCGLKLGVVWYFSVTILSLIICPDKEATALFLAFGYYPILKIFIEKLPLKWVIKLIAYNSVISVTYWLLLNFFGLDYIAEDFSGFGIWLLIVVALLGNVVFIMLDIILTRIFLIIDKNELP